MRKVYSCVDIGSHSIKIIVVEEMNNKFIVLSKAIQKSKGIKLGKIVDQELAYQSLKLAFDKIENDLGIKIENILCTIPGENALIEVATGEIKIKNEIVTDEDISNVLKKATINRISDNEVLITNTPVFYNVDDSDNLRNVVGMSGKVLKVKSVLTKLPKENIGPYFEIFKKINKNIIDLSLNTLGDYYCGRDKNTDKSTTAIINIGYDKTEIGIFNKGIMIKNKLVDTGSRFVDKDISYIYDIERKKSRFLKETFAVSNTRYADVNDITVIENRSGKNISINQLEISEIVEARIRDILKIAKKEINNLTNKEIRYIIITGGITEIAGFQYLVENVLGYTASTLVINEMGIRNNSYSSSIGTIKYFSDKLKKKNKEYSMINENNLEIMTRKYRKTTSENGKVNILNIFTGNNKED